MTPQSNTEANQWEGRKGSSGVQQFNTETGKWEEAIPLPFYWGLFPWIWKRLTGYRDAYGRKARLLNPFEAWEDD
jgi:hypothetical protein